MTAKYDIKINTITGKQLCKFNFEWIDKNDERQVVNTDDLETAQTVISLLSGEICLADLEP
jgi:hypothetical protein